MEPVRVVPESCTACGDCLAACPVSAIEMRGDAAFITEACTVCGICVSTCPAGAIVMEQPAAARLRLRSRLAATLLAGVTRIE